MTDPRPSDTNHKDSVRRNPASRQDWEQLPADPDPREDLGYELLDLEAHQTDADRVLFLPKDEDMIKDEAFIVAAEADVRTLSD